MTIIARVVKIGAVCLAVLAVSYAPNARADDQITPLAASGNWAAMEHSPSVTAPPDVCLAMEMAAGLGFRSDGSDIEVRYENPDWSLPAGVDGNLTIAVNGHNYPLAITDNTNTQVTAVITNDQLNAIVIDMNAASAMTVTAGSAQPISVSLNGSNVVMTAFLTCAGLPSPTGATGGANPFK